MTAALLHRITQFAESAKIGLGREKNSCARVGGGTRYVSRIRLERNAELSWAIFVVNETRNRRDRCVAFVFSNSHYVVESLDHYVAESPDHHVAKSHDHHVAESHDHYVAESHDHYVAESHDHYVAM
ncbi:hypothetical protein COLO4_06496 [Corchorus olitorius]|uniref:Uncharacterized protein n=1 Tax=Corchorus olitorius TaxID=93759 RepID=A0A1R3KN41_9ROSI|nr:hypothetical protein COLO4_06496 [Corchorus olitorius]